MRALSDVLFPHGGGRSGLKSSLALSVTGVVIQGANRLVFSVLVGRIAGPEALGDVGVLVTLATFLALCWPQATASAAGRYVARAESKGDDELAASVAGFSLRMGMVSALGLGLIGVVTARFLLAASWAGAAQTGVLVMAYSAYLVVRGIRTGRAQFAAAAAWDAIGTLMGVGVLVALLMNGEILLLLPLTLGYAASALAGWPRGSGRLDQLRQRELVAYVAWGTVFVLTATGLMQVTLLVASAHADAVEIGEYVAALSLATPASLVAVTLRTALVPSLAGLYATGAHGALRERIDLLMRASVVLITPMFVVGLVWAGPVLELLFGADFLGAEPYLVVLLLGASASSFAAAQAWMMNGPDWGIRVLAATGAAAFVSGVATTAAFGSRHGMLAAAIGYLVGSLVLAAVPLVSVWRSQSMRWGGLGLRLAVAYGTALALAQLGPPPIARAAATGAFLLAWVAMNRSDVQRLTSTLRRTGTTD